MGKESKRRRIYVHESQTPSFIATKATSSRLHRAFIKAPPAAAVAEEGPPPLSNAFEFALGISNDFNGEDQREVNVVDKNIPPDPSGLVVKARAKRYMNSDAPLLTWKESYRQKYLNATLILEGRGRHDLHGSAV
ncbi:hypothetical protein EYR36_010048 [Pleurotus pulmonarius]|nr:hypothetical protein EYR36_010048 [Pleurotus pulmonarius]